MKLIFENKFNYIFLSVLFAISIEQFPFFEENHVNLLRSLALNDYHKLNEDWLVSQTDHVPLFTFLSSNLINFFSIKSINIVHIILSIIYSISIFLICKKNFSNYFSQRILILWFSFLLIIFHEKSFSYGVAGQYILNEAYQPSTFGVLLILSIACFGHSKFYSAIFLAILSAALHPTYLIQAFFLISGYMIFFLYQREFKKIIKYSFFSLILVFPIVFFIYNNFIIFDPIANYEAQKIQAEIRIPHHAMAKIWFSYKDFQSLLIIVLSLVVIFKNKRFFIPLTFVFLISLILTIIQYYNSNNFLGLLFPWRSSVYLMPICSMILITKLLIVFNNKQNLYNRFYNFLNISLIFIIIYFSINGLLSTFSSKNKFDNFPISNSINDYKNEITRILIPTNLEKVRLNSGLPIFIDWKSPPFKSNEVIEWYERIKLSNSFYASNDLETDRQLIKEIMNKEYISHVLIKKKQKKEIFSDCKILFTIKNYALIDLENCI